MVNWSEGVTLWVCLYQPKFLNKKEREELALKQRQQQVEEQRKRMEEEREKRQMFMRQAQGMLGVWLVIKMSVVNDNFITCSCMF